MGAIRFLDLVALGTSGAGVTGQAVSGPGGGATSMGAIRRLVLVEPTPGAALDLPVIMGMTRERETVDAAICRLSNVH